MLVEGFKQIQLRIFLDFHAQVVQPLDRGVAGQEVQRPGAEADDLQAPQTHNSPGNGQELMDPIRALLRVSHGVFGNIGLDLPKLQVVAGVQHAAVSVAPSADQVISAFLRRGDKHGGAVKVFCQESLGNFRAKIAQVHHQSVAPGLFYVLQRLYHVDLAFHNADGALVHTGALRSVFFRKGLHQRLPAVYGKAFREAVSRNSHHTYFYFWNVLHSSSSRFYYSGSLERPKAPSVSPEADGFLRFSF